MKRALLNQMVHEWRNNIWLVIELAIVALAIWAIMVLLWFHCKGLTQPLGFDPQDVYTLDVKGVPETSPYYLPEYKDRFFADRDELVERLRRNPNVKAVSLHNNFAPFEFNYSGNYYKVEGWPDSIGYTGNTRWAQPDIIEVMDIRSTTGKSSQELREMMERNEVLISHNEDIEKKMGPVENLIGKKIGFYYPDEAYKEGWKVGDVVERVRRTDYEYDERGVIILPESYINGWADVILKVKPGRVREFIDDFNSDPSLSKLRNVYFSNLTSLVEKGVNLNREVEINVRLLVGISFFLLVTIFLGLLGSFWFRVQQRVSEMAIRKTFGATRSDLFRRIIGEGMILLSGGLTIASACVWPFIHDLADYTGEDAGVFLAFEGIVAGVMAAGIVLSLLYPACRAMQIEPAIAVKEE